MIDLSDKQKCSGCHACYNSCPKKCIAMREDEEGFLYPSINQDLCINCGICEKVCPFLDSEKKAEPIETWAAKCIDEKLRFSSSSGGIFSLLAMEVIENGGVVFGAAFSSDFKEVSQIAVDNGSDLGKLRTSKYVQSSVGKSYQGVKKYLDDGIEVLYSGVPCQISGLKKYLGKTYENLICVDVICHGAPSPKLWRTYLENIEDKYQAAVTGVNFRHKKLSWENFGINKTIDGIEIFTAKDADPYMLMFLKNESLRPSCYSCHIKEVGSDADISLGDFWGVHNVAPQMNDETGTSLVLIHTKKGQRLYSNISKYADQIEVAYDVAKKYNTPIYKSVNKPQERDELFYDIKIMSFEGLAEKYGTPKRKTLKQKVYDSSFYRRIRSILRRGGIENRFDYGMYILLCKNKKST